MIRRNVPEEEDVADVVIDTGMSQSHIRRCHCSMAVLLAVLIAGPYGINRASTSI